MNTDAWLKSLMGALKRSLVAVVFLAGSVVGCDLLEDSSGDGDDQEESNPPTAVITAPSNGGSYLEGSNICFSGSGSDREDGALSDSALSWASSRDGIIGAGRSVCSDDLSVGNHVITLTVTDSDGLTASDTLNLSINTPTAKVAAKNTLTCGDGGGTSLTITIGGATLKASTSATSSSAKLELGTYPFNATLSSSSCGNHTYSGQAGLSSKDACYLFTTSVEDGNPVLHFGPGSGC